MKIFLLFVLVSAGVLTTEAAPQVFRVEKILNASKLNVEEGLEKLEKIDKIASDALDTEETKLEWVKNEDVIRSLLRIKEGEGKVAICSSALVLKPIDGEPGPDRIGHIVAVLQYSAGNEFVEGYAFLMEFGEMYPEEQVIKIKVTEQRGLLRISAAGESDSTLKSLDGVLDVAGAPWPGEAGIKAVQIFPSAGKDN